MKVLLMILLKIDITHILIQIIIQIGVARQKIVQKEIIQLISKQLSKVKKLILDYRLEWFHNPMFTNQ